MVEALGGARWAAASVSVRINGVGTPWFEQDLRAIAAAGPAARLGDRAQGRERRRPRARRRARSTALDGRRRSERIGLQALIESARGLRDVNQIAEASDRLEALILGPADMSVSLGFPSPDEGSRWDFVRGAVLVAARAAGLQAIDGPLPADRRRRRACATPPAARASSASTASGRSTRRRSSRSNEIFTPTEDEAERARAILDGPRRRRATAR